MNYIQFPILLLVASLSFLSCTQNDPVPDPQAGNINLEITATFDGEPYVITETYDLNSEVSLLFNNLRFFLSDIKLAKSNESFFVELSEIEMVDISGTHSTASDALEGWQKQYENIPGGDYDAIHLGIGVIDELNSTNPDDYSSENMHPLAESGDYWKNWNGYIFSKFEGFYGVNSDPTNSFVYHLGNSNSNNFYRETSLPITVTVNNDTPTIHISLDLKKIFFDGDTYFDFAENPLIHDPENSEVANFLSDNFEAAFSIE